jgi:hypothetical protein
VGVVAVCVPPIVCIENRAKNSVLTLYYQIKRKEITSRSRMYHTKRKESPMLTKNQVIDAICRLNPTAPIDWLSGFDLSALRRYYEHLLITLEPRGTRGWVRMSDTPAVITRRPAA